jgi:hypothetical protein
MEILKQFQFCNPHDQSKDNFARIKKHVALNRWIRIRIGLGAGPRIRGHVIGGIDCQE